MMKKIAVIGNPEKPGVFCAFEELRTWAAARGVEVVTNLGEDRRTVSEVEAFGPGGLAELRRQMDGAELAVTLGGDGTLLYGVHVVAALGLPVLSVNMGSLGFHTQVDPAHLSESLDAYAEGKYKTERRLLLRARLESSNRKFDAEADEATVLNDIVVSKSATGRMVHLRLAIDGTPVTDLFADGLLVATPTGSSAYNYAADGPIVEPSLDAIVLNAICSHRMKFSPVVVGGDTRIEVEFHPRKPSEEAVLLADGIAWRTMTDGQRLNISRAPMYLSLVTFHDDFFQKLRKKLHWGGLG